MYLQNKIEEINDKLMALKSAENIVVWGGGFHTAKLFEKTDLLSYHIKAVLDIDPRKQGEYFYGWIIENPKEIVWEEIDAVVISAPKFEKNITVMLRTEFRFTGDIVTLYSEKETTPFYLLYDEKVPAIRYMGNYARWEDAAQECAGYDDSVIVYKVINAIDKVRRGEAAWERDSCLFYEEKYAYKLCAAFLRCAVHNFKSKRQGVRVLDIGGSLGSAWFQNRKYLMDIEGLEYIVAEQDHFAEYGHDNLENGTLKFIKSTDRWEEQERFDIILMSASLQYISFYQEIISRINRARPRYVILDRVLVGEKKRICVETVPEEIYQSSYPVFIFDENEIAGWFGEGYQMIENDDSSVQEKAYFEEDCAKSKFYVFECKE